ncbi:hypothetical protein [Lactococcus lactis]|uniref:hypothetical protein n=1 Tax=Lactococcus lactis TaxID=1358 RepID=UPI003563F23C
MVDIEKKSSIFDSHKQFLYEEVGKRYYIDTQTFQLFYIKTEINNSSSNQRKNFAQFSGILATILGVLAQSIISSPTYLVKISLVLGMFFLTVLITSLLYFVERMFDYPRFKDLDRGLKAWKYKAIVLVPEKRLRILREVKKHIRIVILICLFFLILTPIFGGLYVITSEPRLFIIYGIVFFLFTLLFPYLILAIKKARIVAIWEKKTRENGNFRKNISTDK